MELVHASNGQIPSGRKPVLGGFDESGNRLYHCLVFDGPAGAKCDIPGMTSPQMVPIFFASPLIFY